MGGRMQVFNAWVAAGSMGEEDRAAKRYVLPLALSLSLSLCLISTPSPFFFFKTYLYGGKAGTDAKGYINQTTDQNGIRAAERGKPGEEPATL